MCGAIERPVPRYDDDLVVYHSSKRRLIHCSFSLAGQSLDSRRSQLRVAWQMQNLRMWVWWFYLIATHVDNSIAYIKDIVYLRKQILLVESKPQPPSHCESHLCLPAAVHPLVQWGWQAEHKSKSTKALCNSKRLKEIEWCENFNDQLRSVMHWDNASTLKECSCSC